MVDATGAGDAFMAGVAGGVFAGFEEIDSWAKSCMERDMMAEPDMKVLFIKM